MAELGTGMVTPGMFLHQLLVAEVALLFSILTNWLM
jgi:hypothetical protein